MWAYSHLLVRFNCGVRPLSAVPVLGKLARGNADWTSFGAQVSSHRSALGKTLTGTLQPSPSPRTTNTPPPPPPIPPLYNCIFGTPIWHPGVGVDQEGKTCGHWLLTLTAFLRGEQLQNWAILGRKRPGNGRESPELGRATRLGLPESSATRAPSELRPQCRACKPSCCYDS